jgi:ABC-type sugar transport system substrate-binding protein
MKRARTAIGCFFVAMALILACSPSEAAQNSNGKTIAILMHSVADEFIYSVYAAADAHAKELGYDTVFVDSKNDAAAQAAAVEDAITQKVDGIMLTPVDASAMSESVLKINSANIPVTMADRTVAEGKFVAVCQSDNYQFGYEGANQIVAAAKKAGVNVADLKVLELQGDLASTSGLQRSQGFQKAASDMGFKIVSSLPTYWRTDTASNAALDALQANPDINAIFLASDGVMADAVGNLR